MPKKQAHKSASHSKRHPKVFIKTFGCQANARDSEFVMGVLLDRGFKKTDSYGSADVILFNSCSVRKHAEDRLFSNIASLAKLKKKRPGVIIGLMGCVAQNYKDKIINRMPLVDIVCGPGDEADLAGMIEDVALHGCPIIAVNKVDTKRPELFPSYREREFKAYVSIGEGCNNFCSYCVVPYVRGRERYRDAKDIIREVKSLAARGFKEVTLLGQNVNSYKSSKPRSDFVELLERLNNIDGLERIRFMTSHPKDASIKLFKAMAGLDKVCAHLHLPFQSGSDKILKLMNRKYTRKKYLKLVREYRKFVPGGSITTDIIAGFPSEREKDFKDTLRLMKEVEFDSAFTFKYSPRPPSRASAMKDDVSKQTKEERLQKLLDLQCEISRRRNESLRGSTIEVIVDGRDERPPYPYTGRTRTNKMVVFTGEDGMIGKKVKIKIASVKPNTLMGEVV